MGKRTTLMCMLLAIAATGCNRPAEPAASTAADAGQGAAAPAAQRAYSDQDISDAYLYLLGRLLVLRQQQLDFGEGFRWNEFVHRKPGKVDWPNPNLDVAYSEAWVALSEDSCTLLTVPAISGRYYTVQFLNGWGETLANINERTQVQHPHGRFAMCLKGAQVELPADALRIDLPDRHVRVLARVELGKDRDGAEKLQHQFALAATGTPPVPEIPKTPLFDIEQLPGVEAFEAGPLALDSDADINPGMEKLQADVRAIAEAIRDPAERSRVDQVIRDKAFADMARASPVIGHGTVGNHWVRAATAGTYGDDWLTRTLINYGGIWANTFDEVIYYKGNLDGTGTQLNSDHVYTLTFPKDALPAVYANYFWSVIAVDTRHFRVLPDNPTGRYLLNKESDLRYNADGSLTLFFAAEKPTDAHEGNWLPTPRGHDYRLTFRFYGPRGAVADGSYFPPPIIRRS
ncbi:MAG: DUF1254 domain-containing protein [Pseudoxanthomonas sp.]|nr:DUF1254 domain-containing protein [Pseudoxanthomonas sp.]